MTNWITTQTDIFRAAVTLRSISNFISDDGTRDGAYGHEKDFGGDIFKNYDAYWKYSPLHYASKVKTPTLVLHSDNDYRVPIEQGEQWFRALQHFGVDVGDRHVPQRKSQPDAHRRTQAPGRKHQLAMLLVRPLLKRQLVGKAPQ